jgi:hypothetical protein
MSVVDLCLQNKGVYHIAFNHIVIKLTTFRPHHQLIINSLSNTSRYPRCVCVQQLKHAFDEVKGR